MRYQDLLNDKSLTREEVVKDDKHYNNTMSTSGRSTKYLREVIIPELRAKANYYEMINAGLKKNNTTKKELSKKVHIQKRLEVNRAKKKLFGKAQTKINIRARDLYADKIKMHMLDRTNYLDGMLHYPITVEWIKKNKSLTEQEFRMFVILYCHLWMLTTEGELFGFTKAQTTRSMNLLMIKGFAQSNTVQRKKAYSATQLGANYMLSYMIFARKKMVAMFRALDAKQEKREGNNWLKYNGKFLYEIDIYEETDINGFDKGTI